MVYVCFHMYYGPCFMHDNFMICMCLYSDSTILFDMCMFIRYINMVYVEIELLITGVYLYMYIPLH